MTPPVPTHAEIRAMRAENAERKAALGPGPKLTATRTVALPGPGNSMVRARLLVPSAEPAGVLVYLHGGGWVLGTIDTFDRLGRELARRTGWVVLMVDYAKAPERPFPAGLEDAWAAYTWAERRIETELRDLLTPPQPGWRLAVGGDSSGGNLATVVARRARDEGVRCDGQVLVYPVTDSDLDRPSHRADPEGRSRMDAFWSLYCRPEQRTHPDAAPLRSASLAGLAPALVLSADEDALNDEIDAYAARLTADGVRVTRHHIPGQAHGCLSYWGTQPAASDALDAVGAWLAGLG